MEFLRSFLRRHLAGKPVVASPNVGCFLRLLNDWHNFRVWALRVAHYASFASAIYQSLSHSRGRFNLVHDKRDTLGRGWELMYGASCWILVVLEPRSANRIAKTESVSEYNFTHCLAASKSFFLVSQSAFNTQFHRLSRQLLLRIWHSSEGASDPEHFFHNALLQNCPPSLQSQWPAKIYLDLCISCSREGILRESLCRGVPPRLSNPNPVQDKIRSLRYPV